MNVIDSIMTKNPCYTAGRKITVKGLMLHSVGCPQPSAMAFIKNWNSASYKTACVHAFIDAITGDVYQTLPWNHRAWHCGASGNNTHIGVEMCEPDCIKYTGGASFVCYDVDRAKAQVKRAYESAVELFALRCKEFNLNPLEKGVIISHKEGCAMGIASNHGDPEHLWNQLNTGYTMDGFRNDVAAKMGNIQPTPAPTTTIDSEKEIFIKAVQSACGAKVDGIAGNETLSKTVTLSRRCNTRHTVVKAVQRYLNYLGYDCGSVDGIFGAKTAAAVARYQKANDCVCDGIITARNKTWKKLLGMAA